VRLFLVLITVFVFFLYDLTGPALTEVKFTGAFANGTVVKGQCHSNMVLILDKPMTDNVRHLSSAHVKPVA